MRLVGQIQGEKEAFTFHAFLNGEGIRNRVESATESGHFHIWVEHEDETEKTRHWLDEFKKNPNDSRFKLQKHPIDEHNAAGKKSPPHRPIVMRRKKMALSSAPFTRFIILLCALLFIWNGYQIAQLGKEKSGARFYNLTPLFMHLCYDVSPRFPLMIDFFKQYFVEKPEELDKLPAKAKAAFQKIEEIPAWSGFYDILLKWPHSEKDLHAPLFIKLRQGEVWRLFTPCLLHGGFLHLLFNMLWLYLLGRQVEERILLWQYVLITLLIGVVSNTLQYLMSGPLFLGYSGIITGLAGFIWMRQRRAPWEGYPLNRGTLLFLGIFIFGMLLLQVVSFVMIRGSVANFPVNIANTAHISGALTGAVLGRIPFFSKGRL